MRTGRLIELVDWKLGPSAAGVMEVLASIGFATPHELETQVLGQGDLAINKIQYRSLLKQLVSSKYINAARQAHFQPPSDRRSDAERFLRKNNILPTGIGKKITTDAEGKVDAELEKRMNGCVSGYDVVQELNLPPNEVDILSCPSYCTDIIRIQPCFPSTFRTSSCAYVMIELHTSPRVSSTDSLAR